MAQIGTKSRRSSSRPARSATPTETASAPQISRTESAPVKPISVNREVADDSVRRFRWPARGRIISDFGTKPGGTRNEGINMALPEGADIKAVCSEAGMMALRERRMKVVHADFQKAKENVLYKKKGGAPEGLYL